MAADPVSSGLGSGEKLLDRGVEGSGESIKINRSRMPSTALLNRLECLRIRADQAGKLVERQATPLANLSKPIVGR
jgi:hypothetical protein